MAKNIIADYGLNLDCFNYTTLINRKKQNGIIEAIDLKQVKIGDMVETSFEHFEKVLTISDHKEIKTS